MNETFSKSAADGFYRCPAFEQFRWQSHAFGTRHANPQPDVTLRQIHSGIVWDATGLSDRQHEGDALISNRPNITIGVRTADCIPILLLDSERRTVAAVHAGWRGTEARIVQNAIRKMNSQAGNVFAAIGPCIRECCYEVGPEVVEKFKDTFPDWQSLPSKPGGKRNLNVPEANIRQLLAAGVPRDQIFDSGLCTSCLLKQFHSFRREPADPGRMISVITLLQTLPSD